MQMPINQIKIDIQKMRTVRPEADVSENFPWHRQILSEALVRAIQILPLVVD